MVRLHRRWSVAAAVVALAALGLVACSGGGDGPSAEREASFGEQPPAPGPPARASAIPDVTVLDVASGGEFALGSVVPSDRPVLVWFWAPH